MKYRVLVVEDHEWWRRYISSALEQTSHWEVVGAVSDGIEAVQKARDLKPDLILLDIGLPSLDGIEAARRMLAHDPSPRILFVSEQQSLDIAEVALGTRRARLRRQIGCRTRVAARDGSSGRRRTFHQREIGGPWFRATDDGQVARELGATKLGSMRTNHRSWMTIRGLRKPRWMPGTVSSWWSPVHGVTGFISDCRRAASTSTALSRNGDVFGWMCRPPCRASWSTAGLTKHDSGTPRALSSWKRREARSGTRLVYPPAGIAPLHYCRTAWWMWPFARAAVGRRDQNIQRRYFLSIFCHGLRCDEESQVFRDIRAAHSAVHVR